MKEHKLIEMSNKVETAGKVLNQIIGEMKMLDERLSGLYMFIQKLPNYDEVLEQLKKEAEENGQE